jgi:hypothetical protein
MVWNQDKLKEFLEGLRGIQTGRHASAAEEVRRSGTALTAVG